MRSSMSLKLESRHGANWAPGDNKVGIMMTFEFRWLHEICKGFGVRHYWKPRVILMPTWSWPVATDVATTTVNSFRPLDALIHRQTKPSSVQIMVCRLYRAKPLHKPMLTFCLLDPWEQMAVKLIKKCDGFPSRNTFQIWKMAIVLSRVSMFNSRSFSTYFYGVFVKYETILVNKISAGCCRLMTSCSMPCWRYFRNHKCNKIFFRFGV